MGLWVLNLGNPERETKAKNSTEHSVGWFFRRMYSEMSLGEFLPMSYSFCPEISRVSNQLQTFGSIGQPKVLLLVSERRSNVKKETPFISSFLRDLLVDHGARTDQELSFYWEQTGEFHPAC